MALENVMERALTGRPPAAAFGTYIIESTLKFARGYVEVGKHTFNHPVEGDLPFNDNTYILNIAISRRLVPSRVHYLDAGNHCAPQDQGRILMLTPGRRVRVTAPAGELRSMHCMLDRAMIETLIRRKPEWSERMLQDAAHLEGPDLEWLMLRIYRELREPGFASALMVEELASAISVEIVRRFRLDCIEAETRSGGLPPWRMRLLRDRAYADAPAPSLTELAALCDLSVRQLRRAFKAETGQTIRKFIEATSVDRARALLADGHPVSEVARRVGFANTSSFSYAFRRATGLRPSEVEGRSRNRRRIPRAM
jgi:AraC family transcriptional regulator